MYTIKMSKKLIYITVLIILISISTSCSKDTTSSEAVREPVGKLVADTTAVPSSSSAGGSIPLRKGYELAILSGQTIDGETYGPGILKKASVSMLNVWTTTCPYCIQEMPMLEELSQKMSKEGIQVIGIIGDGTYNKSDASDIIDSTGVTYLNLIPNKTSAKVIMNIAYAVPTTIFVDSDGKILGEPILGARTEEFYLEQARAARSSL